jgi:hypothetical protein
MNGITSQEVIRHSADSGPFVSWGIVVLFLLALAYAIIRSHRRSS